MNIHSLESFLSSLIKSKLDVSTMHKWQDEQNENVPPSDSLLDYKAQVLELSSVAKRSILS